MAWWLRIQGFNISQATTPYIPMVIYHFASRWQHLISFSSVKPKRRDELKEVGEAVRCPGSVQFSSVAQSCLTLCDPMNCSTPGLPVHHQLPEFTQTHIHRVGDAIQPSLPLSSPSPPAPNPSQHQSPFQ